MMKNRLIYMIILLISVGCYSSCKKFVEVSGPSTSVSSKNVYENDATAIGAVTSLYINLSSEYLTRIGEFTSLSCVAGLSADELTLFANSGNPELQSYYENDLTNATGISNYWSIAYKRIFLVNAALEGLTTTKSLTPQVKQQLLGEVKFMRAFYYFYLVNLYGDVPLVLSSDYTINALIFRSSKSEVYQQIITDLTDARELLNSQYLKADGITAYQAGNEERLRPTKWSAIALLARSYLYIKDWTNAEEQSSLIISNTEQYNLLPLDQVFLKNNREAIWQLQSTTKGINTLDASTFLLPDNGPSSLYPVYLSNDLIENFEAGDERMNVWTENLSVNGTNYFYPYKYKVPSSSGSSITVTEYSTVMRLAEQFLIRSESRAEQGNIDDAIEDVDKIRERAGLSLIKETNPEISKESLIEAIYNERRIEFFTEWGHRWLDLKRTERIDDVMTVATPKKSSGLNWRSFQQYYPILVNELRANPNLTQNTGY